MFIIYKFKGSKKNYKSVFLWKKHIYKVDVWLEEAKSRYEFLLPI